MSIVLQHIDTDGEVIIYEPSSNLNYTNTDINDEIEIHDSLIHDSSHRTTQSHYKLHNRLRDGEYDLYMNEKHAKHNTDDERDNNENNSEDNNDDNIIDIYDGDDRTDEDDDMDGVINGVDNTDDESYVYDNTETDTDIDHQIDVSYTGGMGQLLMTSLEVDDLILY